MVSAPSGRHRPPTLQEEGTAAERPRRLPSQRSSPAVHVRHESDPVTAVVTKTSRNALDVLRRTKTTAPVLAMFKQDPRQRPGWFETALGMLITQRSQVQILAPLPGRCWSGA